MALASSPWPFKNGPHRRRCRRSRWLAERLEDRRLLSGVAGSDDFGDDFDQATPILLAVNGSSSLAGSIETRGDTDLFRIVAPMTGRITIRLETPLGSP